MLRAMRVACGVFVVVVLGAGGAHGSLEKYEVKVF